MIISLVNQKGGVGKTSLVANLGAILARRGRSVMMLDADFGLANLDILLNLSPGKNLGHVFRGEAEAADVVIEVTSGLRVIQAGWDKPAHRRHAALRVATIKAAVCNRVLA